MTQPFLPVPSITPPTSPEPDPVASTLEATAPASVAPVGPSVGRVDEHPAAVYLARLAPAGRRTQRQALETIAQLLTDQRAGMVELPWHLLRYAHTQAVRTQLAAGYAPATVNRMLSALRGVLKECWRLGLTSAEDYHRAADLAPVRGSSLPAGRSLTAGELAALFASCAAGRPGDARDAAVLAVLYAGGLRRSEAVALDADGWQPADGQLAVHHGKGNRSRTVYLTGGAAEAMQGWLGLRASHADADAHPALLWPVDKAGRLRPGRLSGQAVRRLLMRRASKAGVAPFSPHDCRRTFVSHMLEAGADIATVQRLAGHSDPGTTARYDRRPEAVKRQAAGLLHVPYIRPTPHAGA